MGLFALVAPHLFMSEIRQPGMLLLLTVLFGLPMSLFEYLYHRYLLHSAVLPFMSSMHRAHSLHHGLTSVTAPVSPKEPAKLVPVDNEFPIEEEHQEEAMMFPFYALPIFFLIFFGLITVPMKLLFPHLPSVSAMLVGVTLYYSFYELWHQVLHLPFERFWEPLMEGRWTKRVARRVYGFHLMHHWRPSSNLAITGFWGVAVWDYVFRTHRRPERLPLEGAEVNYHDATLAKPLWPISQLDRWQRGLYKASRATENFLARVFLRRGKT